MRRSRAFSDADRSRRRPLLAVVGVSLVSLVAGCATRPIDRPGPLSVRNQHPAQLTAMDAMPRSARTTPPGRIDAAWRFDWTSLWLRPGRGADRLETDGEIVRNEIAGRIGLVPGVDLEIALPFVVASAGVLDSFIESWHRVFGLPQNARDEFPRDEFRVVATRDIGTGEARDAYRLDPHGVRTGDLPIVLTWSPVQPEGARGASFGLRAGVELPTGSERDGYGNGGLDALVGFVAGYDLGLVSLFSWGSHTWVHRADRARDAGLPIPDVDRLGVGGEWAFHDDWSAILQVGWERSVLGRLDDEHAERDQALVWMGGRHRLAEDSRLEFGVAEDLVSDVSPDVTFHVALEIRF